MKKKIGIPLLFLIIMFSVYAGYRLYHSTTIKIMFLKNKMVELPEEPVLGVYDRGNSISQSASRSIRHYALILNNDKPWKLEKNLLADLHDSIPVLLTVEIWDSQILKKTIAGEYDKNITELFTEILKDNRTYYIRLFPHMDTSEGVLAWEMIPSDFTGAFERFSSIIQKVAPRAQMVWGPEGETGVMEFFPLDAHVKMASINLNANLETINSQLPNTIPYQLQRKLHRLRFIDKPILILGSKTINEDSFKMQWLTDAIDYMNNNEEGIYSEENFQRPEIVSQQPKDEELIIGLFDPNLLLVKEKQVSVEHLFTNFNGVRDGTLRLEMEDVISRGHGLIISVEPGPDKENNWDYNLLENIQKGYYDEEIREIYSLISEVNDTVYLRFAHEMEIPITRYPWQSKDPVEYIKAYRYFMNFGEAQHQNIKRIWGPAGDRGSLEWWPGNDVVDYISIAIYGLPDKNITDPEKQESFSRIFGRKSSRFRLLNKPFFITEFGVKGDEEFQNLWLREAAEILKQQNNVIGINYFNYQDSPGAWGEIQPPDWSISQETFRMFLEALNKK
ncbi:MAG: hypothetical protein ABJ092_03560 [Gillisia sp.]